MCELPHARAQQLRRGFPRTVESPYRSAPRHREVTRQNERDAQLARERDRDRREKDDLIHPAEVTDLALVGHVTTSRRGLDYYSQRMFNR
jgi:hypothetical protein